MSVPLFRHALVLLPTLLAACAIFLLMAWHGRAIPMPEWAWLDIAGEGGTAVLMFCWLLWVARSRPGGRVTTLLLLGLSGMFLSMWADALDEVIDLPALVHWDRWLESATMPIGLILVTLGIFHWHQEQLALNQHMLKRERLFREHRHFDALTPLAGANYLRRQVQRELAGNKAATPAFALVLIDLNRFTAVNREHGYSEGDRVLQAISQLLLLNLRQADLLCRLAGDRFVALLPETERAVAEQLAAELEQAVLSFAFKTSRDNRRLQLTASTTVVMPLANESTEDLLARLGQRPLATTTAVAYA